MKIELDWNPDAQTVALKFSQEDFKSWDFIIAVLGMAKDHAEAQRKYQHLAQMQAASQQAEQNAKLMRKLQIA